MTRKPTQLVAAMICAARHWPVFPCWRRNGPWIEALGINDATIDVGTLLKWWNDRYRANIAVVTGRRSGLLVLRVRTRQGVVSLLDLEDRHGPLFDTFRVETPCMLHLYLGLPDECPEIQSCVDLMPGIDLHGEGDHVLFAGSIVGRSVYECDDFSKPVAPVPESLLQWLLEKQQGGVRGK